MYRSKILSSSLFSFECVCVCGGGGGGGGGRGGRGGGGGAFTFHQEVSFSHTNKPNVCPQISIFLFLLPLFQKVKKVVPTVKFLEILRYSLSIQKYFSIFTISRMESISFLLPLNTFIC